MLATVIGGFLGRSSLICKMAKKIVRTQHLLADPNKYIVCEKRKPNARVSLEREHLKNCRVVPTREELLEFIPKGGVCAEVGVAEGYYSRLILDVVRPQKLYMVEYNREYSKNLALRFEKEIKEGVVEILEGDSVEMLSKMPDGFLDFVYLDATHDYNHPREELDLCKDKVKTDGMIAGHDYTRFSVWESEQYGVIEAVNEFMIENDYEMAFITLDMLHSNSTYVIKRMVR